MRAPHADPETPAWAVALLEGQQRIEAELQALRQLITRSRAPRDAQDEALLLAIAEKVAGTRFTASEVIRHARLVPALAEALEAADVDNGIQLGILLKRFTGHEFGGWRLERTDLRDRGGVVYRLQELQG